MFLLIVSGNDDVSKHCAAGTVGQAVSDTIVGWCMYAATAHLLDQNKWIELARAVKGKSDSRLLQVLKILRESKRLGLNLFHCHLPISWKLTNGASFKVERGLVN